MSLAKQIAEACGKAKLGANGEYSCLCPAHAEKSPSASVKGRSDGDIVMKCFTGCSQEDLLNSPIVKQHRDEWKRQRPPMASSDLTWQYHDVDGAVKYKVTRFITKEGRKAYYQSQLDASGNWIKNMKGVDLVLYNLPAIMKAAADQKFIFIVEGEKCADVLISRGLYATTNTGGAGKPWKQSYCDALRGAACVVIIADNDKPGRIHATTIAERLQDNGIDFRLILELPGVGEKGDIFDWLAAGHTETELKALVTATPLNVIPAPPAVGVTENNVTAISAAVGELWNTESKYAAKFVDTYGQRLRFTPENHWMLFDGKRYTPDKHHEVVEFAREMADLTADSISEANIDLRPALLKWAKKCNQKATISNTVALAASDRRVTANFADFDQDQWLLNCNNGIVNLRSGELVPHTPGLLISKLTSFDYDPDAECPQWLDFLSRSHDDQATVDFLQRAAGYTATGSIKEQKVFFVYGPGGTGKSTFLNVLAKALGEYAEEVRAQMFMQKHSENHMDNFSSCAGARFIQVEEIGRTDKLDAPRVKTFSGGDRVRGRFLFAESFKIQPVGKLWFMGNYRPQIDFNDSGIWRRMLVIPFDKQLDAVEDIGLADRIIEHELPGVLAWIVRGCLMWQKGGLGISPAIARANEDYQREMDKIGQFVDETCRKENDPSVWIYSKELYEGYKKYCQQNNVYALSQIVFSRDLKQRGYESKHTDKGTKWLGIDLKPEYL